MSQLTEALRRARPLEGREAIDAHSHPWAADFEAAAVGSQAAAALDATEPIDVDDPAATPSTPDVAVHDAAGHRDLWSGSERRFRSAANRSPVPLLPPRVEQQLSGLIDRVFLPVSGAAVRSVGLAAVGAGVVSSPTTAALAELLAQQTHARVCAIDGNVSSPSLHEQLGVRQPVGAAGELDSSVPLAGLAREVRRNLWVFPMGVADLRPALATDPTGVRLARLIGSFDYVLMDLEPAGVDADGSAVMRLVDGVILIIDARLTRPAVAQRVVAALRSDGVTILGAVLTNRRYPIPGPIYQRL